MRILRSNSTMLMVVPCLVVLMLMSSWRTPLEQVSASGVIESGKVRKEITGQGPILTPVPATPTPQITATAGTAPDLFVDSPDPGREVLWPGAIRSRFVLIDPNLLTNANRLRLNLFNDTEFTAVLDSRQSRVDAFGPAAGPGFIWQGHIEGILSSQVTLVSGISSVAGNIFLPVGYDYILRYAGDGANGIHGVYGVDSSLIPPPDEQGNKTDNLGAKALQAHGTDQIVSR
jgi:hypothetical protein